MKSLILHIPHSSTLIPFYDDYIVSKEVLEQEILKLTDWHTEVLFYSEQDEMIVAEFSRIFCDPERFTDDSQEVMAQFGMGVLYEKTDDGQLMRKVSPEKREEILKNYYWVHHKKFSEAVQKQLDENGKALIVDCHSYPSQPLVRDLDKNPDRPDFNIGIDAFHTPKELIELSKNFFQKHGYSLGVDWPYSGAIVPLEYYGKNQNVQSIMLEINRNLYLKEGSNEKSDNYNQTKEVVQAYMDELRKSL